MNTVVNGIAAKPVDIVVSDVAANEIVKLESGAEAFVLVTWNVRPDKLPADKPAVINSLARINIWCRDPP